MRLLFVTHNYPRHDGDVAGSFLRPLARELRQRGHDLLVIAPSDRGNGGEHLLDGVLVRRVRYALSRHETLAYTGTMGSALRSPSALRAFSGMVEAFRREIHQELRRDPATLVHAHWWVPAGMSVPRGVPHLITCHGTDVRLLDGALPFRFLGRRVLRRANVVTTVSASLAAVIEHRASVVSRVQPMPIAEVPRPRSNGGGGVVMVGRLSAQKRIDLALAGYAAAVREGVDLPLTIVGDGAEMSSITRLIASLGIAGRVTMRGAVAPEEVPEILATADVMLVTSRAEGFGLAAAEAMIQGVPVVACTDGGGLLDIVIDGDGGRVVAPGAAAIAEALVGVVNDPAAAEAAWRQGQRWSRELSAAHVADRCLEWYGDVLAA